MRASRSMLELRKLIRASQCVLDVFITISPGGPTAGGFYIKITLQDSCEITE
jgi:hypothetical protein